MSQDRGTSLWAILLCMLVGALGGYAIEGTIQGACGGAVVGFLGALLLVDG